MWLRLEGEERGVDSESVEDFLEAVDAVEKE